MKILNDKVAVITGAGSGIGKALALELARRGCHVAVSDLKHDAALLTAQACQRRGVDARAYVVDVADRAAMQGFADEVARDFGRINLIFNNAGVYLVSSVRDMSWANLEWLMGINFWGVIHGTKIFLPHLIASGDGHVVNLSSIAGMVGLPYSSAYNASKFAIRGYTESLAQEMELEQLPVKVTCVHPGSIKTDIFKVSRSDSPNRQQSVSALFERMARVTPDTAARVIVKGVLAERRRVLIGADARFLDGLQRLLGVRYQGVNQMLMRLFTP